ncbi:hypothetical protein GQ53DRAFT_847616 [Thozetella sp. PMI_491]|nr:hypothetical protein GQ53DRAFT_847616 [Thozetella sp. PMI_491]
MLARNRVIPALCTFLILDAIAVGLRVWFIERSLGYNDAAMCLAFTGFLLLGIITFVSFGYGFGDTDMTKSEYNPLLAAKIMPGFLLGGVQMSLRIKLSVLALLGLGVVSGVATFLRLSSMIQIITLGSASQGTQQGVEIYLSNFMYSVIEIGLTIFTASLAALRPLLKYVPFGSGSSRDKSNLELDSGLKMIGESSGGHQHIRLEDLPDKDSRSQELILGDSNAIVEKVDYKVTYSGKDTEVTYPRYTPL